MIHAPEEYHGDRANGTAQPAVKAVARRGNEQRVRVTVDHHGARVIPSAPARSRGAFYIEAAADIEPVRPVWLELTTAESTELM